MIWKDAERMVCGTTNSSNIMANFFTIPGFATPPCPHTGRPVWSAGQAHFQTMMELYFTKRAAPMTSD